MSEPWTAEERARRLGLKPSQPAWIASTMRLVALAFVLLILAAMGGVVAWIWRAALHVGA